MPAAITLSDLSWSTPEGRTLFTCLNLTLGRERTGLVGRNGVGKSTLLGLITGAARLQSGAVSVSGSLGVLRQNVQVNSHETIADLFGAAGELALLRRAVSGNASAEEVVAADWTLEARIGASLARAGLDVGADTLLADLSGGQCTRAGLAALLFGEPDYLILDEPTNNLDREGREAIIALLAGWRGGALVVSHDRELLETMDAIVELTSLGATRYGGGWNLYRERKHLAQEAARLDLANAEKLVEQAARDAQAAVERQARRDSIGRKRAGRGDIPRIALGAMRDSSEATSAANASAADRRRTRALDEVAAMRERIEVLQPLSVTLASTELPATKVVLRLDAVTAGYRPGEPIIQDLSFQITGPERIGVVGPNGSGKTTLLALVSGVLRPWSGKVTVNVGCAIMDQQMSLLDPALSIRDNYRQLNPGAGENACRAALARFMFRADAALQSVGTLSGGQMLRAGLACVLGGPTPPSLLILDEPTNHLDLDSIEAVESGLRGYDGALLVVSHDELFLEGIEVARRLALGGRP